MSSSPSRHLSKVEQYKLKKQETEAAQGGVSGFFDRFGHQEKSGLGRVGAVVASENTTPTKSAAVQHQQPQLHQPSLQQFPPIQNTSPSFLMQGSGPSRNSPLAGHNVSTLEAKELQQQLDVIRSMRDADASISYNSASLPEDLMHHRRGSSNSPHQQREEINNSSSSTVVCFCCNKVVPKSVVAYVPRDSVSVAKATTPPVTNRKAPAVTAAAAAAAAAAKSKPRVRTSGAGGGGKKLEEVRGQWKI